MIKRTLSRQEQIARATDPTFALIGEENRLRNLGSDFRARADMAWYALSKEEQAQHRAGPHNDPDGPEPCGRLYEEARRYEEAAGDIHDRIVATPATTIAGIVAKLEYDGDDSELAQSVIKDLQRMAAAKDGEAQP
jgi:hypothetical protein